MFFTELWDLRRAIIGQKYVTGGILISLAVRFGEEKRPDLGGIPWCPTRKRMENFHKACKKKHAPNCCSSDLKMVTTYFRREKGTSLFFCSISLNSAKEEHNMPGAIWKMPLWNLGNMAFFKVCLYFSNHSSPKLGTFTPTKNTF